MFSPLITVIKVFALFIFALFLTIALGIIILLIYYRRKYYRKREKRKDANHLKIAMFHPYCNDGGGGEKVLWTAVRCILKNHPNVKICIYTGDVEYSPNEILSKIKQRFNIILPAAIDFIYLHKRKWVEAEMYPIFTLLGQSLGSVYLGMEALSAYQPGISSSGELKAANYYYFECYKNSCASDLFLDTMGYAFTYPVFKYIGHCKVACYTHYPTITSDMLRRVSSRISTYNNSRRVARSPFLTAGKLIYYKIFSVLYGWVGKSADVVMVNSSWTEQHINELWQRPLSIHCVYPPCNVDDLKAITRTENDGKGLIKIISIGQFRPEKNHPLQLQAMYQLRQLIPETVWDRVQLVLIGGCRNAEDKNRVRDMEDLCKHLSLENNVVFKLNIPYPELKKELSEASIGLHAMWNEHFGIGVVECLAAGLITIAHRSGGPKSDIIIESEGSRNGFLAYDDDEYAQYMAQVIHMSPKQKESIIAAARSSVDRFSVEEFEKQFLRTLNPLLKE